MEGVLEGVGKHRKRWGYLNFVITFQNYSYFLRKIVIYHNLQPIIKRGLKERTKMRELKRNKREIYILY